MHICPHCHKLGISTYASLGDLFSRGLASCRYCTNVSKIRRNFFTSFIMVAALALFWAIVHFLPPPTFGFGLLYLSMLGGIALMLIDRLTEFDKYQPPTKGDDLAKSTVARSETGAARVSLLLLLLALAVPYTSFAEGQSLRQSLGLKDADSRTPASMGRHVHGKCGDLDMFGKYITGTMQGHAISAHQDGGVITFTIDGARTTTGFTDASGRLAQIIDENGNAKAPLRLTPEQARAAVERLSARIAQLADNCGETIITDTTKGCNPYDNSLDAPAPPGTDPGNAGGTPGAATTKGCLDDPMESEDFWISYLTSYYVHQYDPNNALEMAACLAGKMSCQSGCNDGMSRASLLCGAAAFIPVTGPYIAFVCTGAAYWLTSNCLADCQGSFPQC